MRESSPGAFLEHAVDDSVFVDLGHKCRHGTGLGHDGEEVFLVLLEACVALTATGNCQKVGRIWLLKQTARHDMIPGRGPSQAVITSPTRTHHPPHRALSIGNNADLALPEAATVP